MKYAFCNQLFIKLVWHANFDNNWTTSISRKSFQVIVTNCIWGCIKNAIAKVLASVLTPQFSVLSSQTPALQAFEFWHGHAIFLTREIKILGVQSVCCPLPLCLPLHASRRRASHSSVMPVICRIEFLIKLGYISCFPLQSAYEPQCWLPAGPSFRLAWLSFRWAGPDSSI